MQLASRLLMHKGNLDRVCVQCTPPVIRRNTHESLFVFGRGKIGFDCRLARQVLVACIQAV